MTEDVSSSTQDSASRGSRYYEPAIECASRADLQAVQADRILESIDHALGRSSFTQQLWARAGLRKCDVKSLDDFFRLAPGFTQRDVTEWATEWNDPYGGLLCMDTGVSFIAATTGTSGTPMALPQYRGNPRAIASCRDLWEEQVPLGGTVLRTVSPARVGIVAFDWPVIDERELRVITVPNHPSYAPAIIDASLKYRPVSYMPMSVPMIGALEAECLRRGIEPQSVFDSYSHVTFGGEPLGPRERDKLQNWFGTVRSRTSLGNTIAATECDAGDGAHTWEDLVLVEVLEPKSSEKVEDGAIGELVVTTLHEHATPLLRFRTDDLVTRTTDKCSCGRTHGRIQTLGRKGDMVTVADRVILPSMLLPIVGSFDETGANLYQLVRGSTEILRVRVGIPGRSANESGLRRAIEEKISTLLDVPCVVDLVNAAQLVSSGPGYKIARVVSA